MRTEADIAAGYTRYRGKCKTACDDILKAFPTLRLVRGHIMVPHWPSDPFQPHWWLVNDRNGRVIDPTWGQFPFQAKPNPSLYEEFDGHVECDACGQDGLEADFIFYGRYCFCSDACGNKFVGLT